MHCQIVVLSTLAVVLSNSNAFRLNSKRFISSVSLRQQPLLMSVAANEDKKTKQFIRNIVEYHNSRDDDDFNEDGDDSDTGMFLDLMQEVDVRPALYRTSKEEEVRLMIEADVSQSDIFYDANNKMMKTKSQLIEEQKFQEVCKCTKTWTKIFVIFIRYNVFVVIIFLPLFFQ